jgi:hypothetical protein
VVAARTETVVRVKVALVAPAGTLTLAGTVIAVEFSERVIVAPPAGAAVLRVTVPIEEAPPTRLVGFTDSVESAGGGGGVAPAVIINSACRPGLPAKSAKTFILNVSVTAKVEIGKVAVVVPAGTVTLNGRVATFAGAAVDKAMVVAPLCWALKVTVPVEGLPPTTVPGFTDTPESTGGGGGTRTVSVAVQL